MISLGLFFATLGPRKDLAPALETWRFDLKLVLVVLALVLAFGLCRALSRPVPPRIRAVICCRWLVLAPAAVAIECAVVPAAPGGRGWSAAIR